MDLSRQIKSGCGDKNRFTRMFEILVVSLRLGLTSFGGPIAHLSYFHYEYVERRRWMDERNYADLVALSQFLPGPASSQVGIGMGLRRGGLPGGFLSFLGFTIPSAVIMLLVALVVQDTDVQGAGWVYGLKLVTVAIVAHAVMSMGRRLASGKKRATIAAVTMIVLLLSATAYAQAGLILAGGLVGLYVFRDAEPDEAKNIEVGVSKRFGGICLGLFLFLLIVLPLLARFASHPALALFDIFYRAGSLVFGGGHVVLPLLQHEMVPAGWVDTETFLAGYGAAQALPGPLLTFATYLGASAYGLLGAAIATAGMFLPSFLVLFGTLPFWDSLRKKPWARGGLKGINAAVVGILAAALYDPIFTSSVHSSLDFIIVVGLFGLLAVWKTPSWVVVALGAGLGILIGSLT